MGPDASDLVVKLVEKADHTAGSALKRHIEHQNKSNYSWAGLVGFWRRGVKPSTGNQRSTKEELRHWCTIL